MLDIKTWLETTEMKVAEERFSKPPALPYVIFSYELNASLIADRNISIELYSAKIDNEAELKIQTLLNEKLIQYKRVRTWIDSEKFYQTVYDFNLVEKF